MPIHRPAEERFWEKVTKTDGCWFWTASVKTNGYGSFWNGSRNIVAHRWSYESLVGPVPDGLELDHLCRVRHCVNPAHLEPVTHAENGRRGNSGKIPQTHCKRGHEYTEQNTAWIREPLGNQYRVCRECERIRDRKRYWAKRDRLLTEGSDDGQ